MYIRGSIRNVMCAIISNEEGFEAMEGFETTNLQHVHYVRKDHVGNKSLQG